MEPDANTNRIECPQCGTLIDVNHQLEDQINKKYQKKLAENSAIIEERARNLDRQMADFEAKKKIENQLFQEKLEKQLQSERNQLELKLEQERAANQQKLLQATQAIEKQQEEKIALKYSSLVSELQKELNDSNIQIKELNQAKIEIERLKREKDLLRETIQLETEQLFTKQLAEQTERIKKSEQERSELAFRELQKKHDTLVQDMNEMKRRQEQGSMQLQGEVQELAIEEWLAGKFPLDTVMEVKKGERGGDCLQVVNTYSRQNCGTIYYESKRTKVFQPQWIEKFKADIRERNATLGVLITEAMPTDMDRLGLRDGVWICTFQEFKNLSFILREHIIQLSQASLAQENRGDKMVMMYNYLTSNTFRMQVEAIVEGFSQMKNDLESEKRAMARLWKTREKQLEKVLVNTIDMHASIKGIAGSAIQDIRQLDFPEQELLLDE